VSAGGITLETAVGAINQVLGERRPNWTPVDADARLVELGLDSLDISELFIVLEEAMGRQLDPMSAGGLERVGDLVKLRPL
jgi:acyl carrier protein